MDGMDESGPSYWIGVVSRQHVLRGIAGGFAQIGHGKAAPLRRMAVGDWLIYYSPVETLGESVPCRRVSPLRRVRRAGGYQVGMGGGLTAVPPGRRFPPAGRGAVPPPDHG